MRLATHHTADLSGDELDLLHAMLREAFSAEGYPPIYWRHALGGLHVLARDQDGAIVGHAAVIARSFLHRGRQLRCGYVESVGTPPAHRRRGIGEAVMGRVNEIVERGYEIGALSASTAGGRLYRRCGWTPWPDGNTAAFVETGIRDVPSDESGWVWTLDPGGLLDREERLVCDWRDGDLW